MLSLEGEGAPDLQLQERHPIRCMTIISRGSNNVAFVSGLEIA